MKKSIFAIVLSLFFVAAQAQDDAMKVEGPLLFNENSEAKEAFVLVSDANLRINLLQKQLQLLNCLLRQKYRFSNKRKIH